MAKLWLGYTWRDMAIQKTALIIVDMLKDSLDIDSPLCMKKGREIIPNVQRLLTACRSKGLPIIFANDSFLPDDFMFAQTGRKPHAIMGTEGAKVIAELGPEETDIILPKRRLSAFFGTGLETRLREMGVGIIAVAGITTPICVLSTVLDGMAHDFRMILLEDCCTALRQEDHEAVVKVYRRGMAPLLQVMRSEDFLSTLDAGSA